MISIFNGTRRTLGKPAERDIHAKIDVDFRKYIKHFKGAKLAVFLAIALHINEDGECNPSYDLLEEETGLGRDTIAKALQELCELEIEGSRILTKWRTRNDKGQLIGSNNYKIFPTDSDTQSWTNPTLDKCLLEEEPSFKEEPKQHSASPKVKKERPRDLLFDTIKEEFALPSERVGTIKGILLGTLPSSNKASHYNLEESATVEEVQSFAKWYRTKYPRVSLPTSPEKLHTHFYRFRLEKNPKQVAPQVRVNDLGIPQEFKYGMWVDNPTLDMSLYG